MRLPETLPDATPYKSDAYGVYGTLPINKHIIWRVRCAVN